MSFKVETLPTFEREAKRLSRKYKSLREDLFKLIMSLEADPGRHAIKWRFF